MKIKKIFVLFVLVCLLQTATAIEPPNFQNYSSYADLSDVEMNVTGIFEWFFGIMNSRTANLFSPILLLAAMITIYIKNESIDILYLMILFSASLIKIWFMADFSNVIYWLLVLPISVVIYKVIAGR